MAVSLGVRTYLKNKLFHWLDSSLCGNKFTSIASPTMIKLQRYFSDDPDKKVHHGSLKPPDGVPCTVFRKFSTPDEQLGPGADPNGDYKNPEYYGYHKKSFADFLVSILEIRENSKKDRSPIKCLYECEKTDEAGETREATDEKICMQITILPEGEGKVCGDPAQADECGLIEREETSGCPKEEPTPDKVSKAPKEKLKKKKKGKKDKKKRKK